jgi:hypothetical protein
MNIVIKSATANNLIFMLDLFCYLQHRPRHFLSLTHSTKTRYAVNCAAFFDVQKHNTISRHDHYNIFGFWCIVLIVTVLSCSIPVIESL